MRADTKKTTEMPTAYIIIVVAAAEIHMDMKPVACIMPRMIRAVMAVIRRASGGIPSGAGRSRTERAASGPASNPLDWCAADRAGAAVFLHVVVMGFGPRLSCGPT